MQYFKRKKEQARNIAVERVEELFRQADNAFEKHPERSNRYVALALKIASKYKVRIPTVLKRRYCKHCHSYLVLGVNARVRLNKGKKTYFCMNCGTYTRIPYK